MQDYVREYWRVSGAGMLLASFFFAASLTPSFIPRSAILQGALSGVSAAVGYAVAVLLWWIWKLMALPSGTTAERNRYRGMALLISLAICAVALWHAADWQNATRITLQQPEVERIHAVAVFAVALVVFSILWVVGGTLMMLFHNISSALSSVLPGNVGPVLSAIAALWIFWALIDGVLLRRGMAAADNFYAAGEKVFAPGQDPPGDPNVTGGTASLVSWFALGNRGRDFIARTPRAEEIAGYWGPGAKRPIRVYIGRISADTPRARAEIALQELIRQGGFERKILVITTPVGTGWMDPGSHDVLDFMFGGDTAHVAAQYSYLTSTLSIITNVEYGLDQARALFDVIYGYWTSLPPETRPKLYLHGLSQGALNSQATMPLLDVLDDPPDGAFWAGSPFVSPVWDRVRRNRKPESPIWRPKYGNGSLVRVTNQENVLDDFDADWGPMRFVFLNYGSDPIVNFEVAALWRRPEWLNDPRPHDIAPQMRWFPIVTALQLLLDMTTALKVQGYGHFYYYDDYIDGWAAMTDPPGWSADQAEKLKQVFALRPAPW